jgi:hypothetical protein
MRVPAGAGADAEQLLGGVARLFVRLPDDTARSGDADARPSAMWASFFTVTAPAVAAPAHLPRGVYCVSCVWCFFVCVVYTNRHV